MGTERYVWDRDHLMSQPSFIGEPVPPEHEYILLDRLGRGVLAKVDGDFDDGWVSYTAEEGHPGLVPEHGTVHADLDEAMDTAESRLGIDYGDVERPDFGGDRGNGPHYRERMADAVREELEWWEENRRRGVPAT